MARIARMVLTSLSLFLGMFFFFFGLIKVSRGLNAEIHREMRRNFVRYAKVVPIITTNIGWRVPPHSYRLLIGYSEIVAGLLLAFCPGRTKQICNLFLICLCLGAIYTHVMVLDDYSKMIPAVVFCSMLCTRLILYLLLKRIPTDEESESSRLPPPPLSKLESEESFDEPKVKIIKIINHEDESKNILWKFFSWFRPGDGNHHQLPPPKSSPITEPSSIVHQSSSITKSDIVVQSRRPRRSRTSKHIKKD